MANKRPKDLAAEFDRDAFDFPFDDPEPTPTKRKCSKKTKPTSIVNAMDKILTAIYKSGLDASSKRMARPALDYLNERLGLTDMQCMFLSMLCNAGNKMDYYKFSDYIGCHRILLVSFDAELQELVRKGIINRIPCDMGEDDYVVRADAMTAYQKNEKYETPSIVNLTLEEFMFNFAYLMNKLDHGNITYDNFNLDMDNLFKSNPDLHIVREINNLNLDTDDRNVLLACIHSYVECGENVSERVISKYIQNGSYARILLGKLKRGAHSLISDGIMVQSCEEGFMSGKMYELTDAAKENLLQGIDMDDARHIDPRKGLLLYDEIKKKSLFYNDAEGEQIRRLTDLLKEENFKGIQQRLEEKGMRKGFSCLFYGAPGTGKTESVLQIARLTGRDIFQVNIAGLRDKFVGESEKNIKAVFTRYKNICKHSEKAPILLFNEADAIINKRTDKIQQSVDKMDNAMQDIILNELEQLEGIMIATTNLTSNLDNAFERRFIYKIEFKKPTAEVKANIWKSMISDISEEDAKALSRSYDFSGGEIENISRKLTVDNILYGSKTTLIQLRKYCECELLTKNMERSKVCGFSRAV